jgi:hypothetical protein
MEKKVHNSKKIKQLFVIFVVLFSFQNGLKSQTSIVVNSLADDGSAGTLRWAIGQANATSGGIYDAITFNVSGTILLTSHLPTITQAVTITGPGQNNLTIDGNNLYRVFLNTSSIAIAISDMTLTKGFTGTIDQQGGLIWNQNGTLTITNVTFSNMTLNISQSAAFCQKQGGVTTFNYCTFTNLNAGINTNHGGTPSTTSNVETDYGNRVYVNNSTFSNNIRGIETERFTKINNCTFTNNSACGASIQGLNRHTVTNSTFSNNGTGVRTSCGIPTTWTFTNLNQLIQYNTFSSNTYAIDLSNNWNGTMSYNANYIATVSDNCFIGNNVTISGATGYTQSNNTTTSLAAITGSSNVCLGSTITLANSTSGGTWSSSNTAIATVNSSGVVTPIAAGTVVISYSMTGACANAAVTKTITVNAPSFNTTLASGNFVWLGTTSTDWSTVSNWASYNGTALVPAIAIPTATAITIVPLNGTCVLNQPTLASGTVSTSSIIIESGATLTLGSGTLNVTGNFTNNGIFTAGTGTIQFNGSALQTLTGSTNFYNLIMNNSAGLSLNSPIKVSNNLTLTSGVINASNPSTHVNADGTSLAGWTISATGHVIVDPSQGNTGSSFKIGGLGWNNMSMKMDLGEDFKNKIIQFDYRPTGSSGFAGVTFGAPISGSGGIGLNLGVGTQTTNGLGDTQNFLYQNASNNTYTFVAGTWYTIKIVTDNGTVGGTKWYVNNVLVGNSGVNAIGNGTYIGFVNNNMSTGSTGVNFDNISITSTAGSVTLGASSAVPGSLTYTSGTILGKMKRYFSAAATTTTGGLFPVGTAAYNRFAKVNFTSSPGTNQFLTVEYKTGAPLNASNAPLYAGLPATIAGQIVQVYSADGYWQIDPTDNNYASTICTTPYNLTLNANNLTNFNNPSTVRIIKAAGSNTLANHHVSWQGAGTHTPNATTNATVAEISSTNCTGFSWFNIGTWNDQALPVELTSFSSECKETGVDINWQTASEHSSSHFTVEKSRDGLNWMHLASLAAAGNSSTLINYSFTDVEKSGVAYYRLQQVDQDGAEKTYGPISSSCERITGLIMKTYPNPSSDLFTINIESEVPMAVAQIILKDVFGRIVATKAVSIVAGATQVEFSVADIESGIYSVTLEENGTAIKTVKQVIQ